MPKGLRCAERSEPGSYHYRLLRPLLLGALALALAPPPLTATCTCTVSATVTPPSMQVAGSTGGSCTHNVPVGMNIFRDGGLIASRVCGQDETTCDYNDVHSSACLRTGTHTLDASCFCGQGPEGIDCEGDSGTGASTFFVNTTPKVEPTVAGPDSLGDASLVVPFEFPNTAQAASRNIGVFRDGSFLFGHAPQEVSGTWTHEFSTACWRDGPHEVNVLATACNAFGDKDYQHQAVVTVTVGTKPEVGLSADGPDAEGLATFSVPFNFENTSQAASRNLGLFRDGSFLAAQAPQQTAGTWTLERDTSCWAQGARDMKVVAIACNAGDDPAYRTEATTPLVIDHMPEITLTLKPKDPTKPEGVQIATVTYSFPQTRSAPQRHVSLTAFPSGSTLAALQPSEREGEFTVEVSCAQGANHRLVATGKACGDTETRAVADLPGCPAPPRMDPCRKSEDRCDNSCSGPGGGVPAGGGGPGLGGGGGPEFGGGDPGFGPGARLAYLAGGAGSPGSPGQAEWNEVLGQNWGHHYSERLVPDPSVAGRVWLITRSASFVRFTDADGDGLYEAVMPEDEYRSLTKTATGWVLGDLHGAVQHFDASGLWQRTEDRNGKAKTANYSGGRLVAVAMPDGRSESFAYHPSGKLAAITEIGVGGEAERTWGYGWEGDNLVSIARPDGTDLRFVYGDTRHPGAITRHLLIGADDGDPTTPRPERVEGAWDYDTQGNVLRAWRGDDDSALGVDRYEFAYDNPFEPTETTVTIHRSATDRDTVIYTLSRTQRWVGAKPRVTSISGDCTSCGLGPNSQLFYDDPQNPLLPTRILDGRGNETLLAYDANGRLVEKVEAAGTPESRTTAWAYEDTSFPALPTRVEVPSIAGGTALRTTRFGYDAQGNAESRREQGIEAGAFFDLETVTTFNAAGQPLTIDPPGHGLEDVTSFTYDPARGDLLPLTRTDPLIGTTVFEHDAFNRRTAVIDPNGLRTETIYDAGNRIVGIIQHGATVAEDLVTKHVYNAFGDLVRTILPRGNVIEYTHDPAGRPVAVERKPDELTPGERTFYTLDGLGNRVREELQRWAGEEWVTVSFTDFVYQNRCQLQKTVHADGTATEHAYDCAGNLEKAWDPNHSREGGGAGGGGEGEDCDEPPCEPPGGGPNPPTQIFEYDALNRLVRVRQPWTGEGGGEAVTSYELDAQDHLTAVTDAEGNTTTYQSSDRDLLTTEISPVSGTTTYSYDEHGSLVGETDARGVKVGRVVDALDRMTFIDSPDPALDTTYVYDDPAVPFSKGRLTAISREGTTVAYSYDRFGRTIQDGELTFGFDANGNRTEIGYPGGVVARYGHDFADREASLEVQVGTAAPQPIVTAAGYEPFGPLSSLTLGSGLTESRGFTARYFPGAITVPGRLDQRYTTDATGNIRTIDRAVGVDRFLASYVYQTPQYYLTEGNGPWGQRAWSYDRIGNRLSEGPPGSDKDSPEVFLYTYEANPAGGNTPKLASIEPAPSGEPGSHLDYGFDPAGNQTEVVTVGAECSGRTSFLDYSAERRLSRLSTSDGPGVTDLAYDGRGFLVRSHLTFAEASDFVNTRPVYTSDGLLLARRFHQQTTVGGGEDGGPEIEPVTQHTTFLFYFAGRPVAQLRRHDLGAAEDELLFLTTDHLGVPILATDKTGETVWAGGLDPWGAPFVFPRPKPPGDDDPVPPPPGDGDGLTICEPEAPEGSASVESIGLFLRFPGQWDDPSFHSHGLRGGLHYNVYRWYEPGTGRYTRPDPLGAGGPSSFSPFQSAQFSLARVRGIAGDPAGWRQDGANLYSYALSNPLSFTDPLGLEPVSCSVFRLSSRMDPVNPFDPVFPREPGNDSEYVCTMVGGCVGANGKVYLTAGTIRVPECFRCPSTCTFEAESTQFWSKGSKKWQCQPDTVITSIFP